MTDENENLTARQLHKLLRYNASTGIFRWKVHRSGIKIDSIAGSRGSRGYYQIRIDGKLYQSSRLAWLYMTGRWPKFEIHFINRNKSDTRWANLREMAPSLRRINARRQSKLGVIGVYATDSGKYVARIRVAGKRKISEHSIQLRKPARLTPKPRKACSLNLRGHGEANAMSRFGPLADIRPMESVQEVFRLRTN